MKSHLAPSAAHFVRDLPGTPPSDFAWKFSLNFRTFSVHNMHIREVKIELETLYLHYIRHAGWRIW